MTEHDRLSAEEAGRFLRDRTLHAFDPATGERVGAVTYRADGTCLARLASGDDSPGVWGLTDSGYWTRYERFRDGERHAFTLVPVGAHAAQAYFSDGSRAFLQTPDAEFPGGGLQG